MNKIAKLKCQRVLILQFFIVLCLYGKSQNPDEQEPYLKTLYTLKMEPSSCACNLENLFDNWKTAGYIVNSKDLELLSFSSSGILNDSIDIEYYITCMTGFESPFFSSSGSTENGISYRSYTIDAYKSIYERIKDSLDVKQKEELINSMKSELETIRKGLSSLLKIGDRIFLINASYKGKSLIFYVFCDPQTYKMKDIYFNNFTFNEQEP